MTSQPTQLLSEEQISSRVKELGDAITRDYKDKDLVCVAVLKGSVVFFADLIRNIRLPLAVDFLGATSYGSETTSSGVVKFTLDVSVPVRGRHVLLVEDIIDTGLTIDYMKEHLKGKDPTSVKICSLLFKPSKFKTKVQIDYLGFSVEDRFLVGYGLDRGEQYRNLPYIGYV